MLFNMTKAAKQIAAKNIKALLDANNLKASDLVASKTLPQRTAYNLMHPDRDGAPESSLLSNYEAIADKLSVPIWILFVDGLADDLVKTKDLQNLVKAFVRSSPEGRKSTLSVADGWMQLGNVKSAKKTA